MNCTDVIKAEIRLVFEDLERTSTYAGTIEGDLERLRERSMITESLLQRVLTLLDVL